MSTSTFSAYASRLRLFITQSRVTNHGARSPASFSDPSFNALALELFGLQYRHNPAARRFWDAQRTSPTEVKHWSEIPPLPAVAFKELDLTCIPDEERTAVFHSSGTTEQRPSRHFHDAESLALYEESVWHGFQAQVRSDAQNAKSQFDLVSLTPPPPAARTSSLVHMFETVGRRWNQGTLSFCGVTDSEGSWSLASDQVESLLNETIRLRRPVLLLGTAFNFVHLLDEWAVDEKAFRLPSGSLVLETGGYKGRSRSLPKPVLHDLICQRLGLRGADILCEYGMSELSSQAYDHVPGLAGVESGEPRCFRFPPWAREQVVSPATGLEVKVGETGLLRIVDLANLKSVLALQTEDLAVRRPGGFELLGRASQAEPRGCSLLAAGEQGGTP